MLPPPPAPAPTPAAPTAEQLIDAIIVRAPTGRIVIHLTEAGISHADITPALLARYKVANWRTVELTADTLTLSC